MLSNTSDVDTPVTHNKQAAVTTTVSSHPRPEPAVHQSRSRTNGSCPEKEPLLGDHYEEQERLQWEPLGCSENYSKAKGTPKFEAYMMTGEHILNISRVPPGSLLQKQPKKVSYFTNVIMLSKGVQTT